MNFLSMYLCLSSRMKNPCEVPCLSLVRLRECQTWLFAKLVLAWGILDLFPVHLLSPPVCRITPDHSLDQSVSLRQFRSEGTFESLCSNLSKVRSCSVRPDCLLPCWGKL